MHENKKILVLGATGMLGNVVLRYFAERGRYSVSGTVRSTAGAQRLPINLRERLVVGIDVQDPHSLAPVFTLTQPDVVINCVGLVKQLAEASDPLLAIPINSLLPHRLSRLCEEAGARLIHISTDCVFSGRKGMYTEEDVADATDLYGLSKYLGEVDYPHAVTLRTSIIGREFGIAHGLVDWFLQQQRSVQGYTQAVFSGLPTVELAHVMHDFVVPNAALRGVYHVAAAPIDKDALLRLVASVYGKDIQIIPDSRVMIDRSLDASRFNSVSGYSPPDWPELVARMHAFS